MSCLYIEIEGQSCLVDSVDRVLVEIDQLGRMPKKSIQKNIYIFSFFPP